MSTAATAPPASAATPVAAADAAAPAASADPSCISVRVEFSGGLELLFDRIKSRTLTLSPSALGLASSDELTMRALIEHLKQRYCTERHELFVAEDSVRPGILVLINDTDWELEDGLEYRLRDGDTIVFISTLHGG